MTYISHALPASIFEALHHLQYDLLFEFDLKYVLNFLKTLATEPLKNSCSATNLDSLLIIEESLIDLNYGFFVMQMTSLWPLLYFNQRGHTFFFQNMLDKLR